MNSIKMINDGKLSTSIPKNFSITFMANKLTSAIFSANSSWKNSLYWLLLSLQCIVVNRCFIHSDETRWKLVRIAIKDSQAILRNCSQLRLWSIVHKRGTHLDDSFLVYKRSLNVETIEPCYKPMASRFSITSIDQRSILNFLLFRVYQPQMGLQSEPLKLIGQSLQNTYPAYLFFDWCFLSKIIMKVCEHYRQNSQWILVTDESSVAFQMRIWKIQITWTYWPILVNKKNCLSCTNIPTFRQFTLHYPH